MAVAGAGTTTGITTPGADITVGQPANLVFLKPLTAKAAVAPVYLRCHGVRSLCRVQPVTPIIR